jgi:NAD(P)-dependent dehydrogenase (short-subunit alcohol dehydrogenase family)
MEKLQERVAVITGGGSGIGRALADRFAAEGMKLVLADVEAPALDVAVSDLHAAGAEAIGVPTDVSRLDQVEALAEAAIAEFGAVHLICNNAGVEGGALFGEMSQKTWEWVMDVNFWGVLNGCRVFLPLLEQQEEGHMVNTASHAAFTSGLPTFHAYVASKSAVAAMSANLEIELRRLTDSRVGVSLLVPGPVRTRMNESERNRPEDVPPTDRDELRVKIHEEIGQATEAFGVSPEEVAELVVEAIREPRFYIFTHPEMTIGAAERQVEWMKGGPAPGPPIAEDREVIGR